MAPFAKHSVQFIDRAVELGCHNVVELLVLNALFDPLHDERELNGPATTGRVAVVGPNPNDLVPPEVAHQRTRRFHQLLQLAERIQDSEAYERTKLLLESFKNHEDFQEVVMRLSQLPQDDQFPAGEEVAKELHQLVPKITRVYDLSALYSLSKTYLGTKEAQKELFISACQHIFNRKLVLDRRECAFMSIALEHVEREGLLCKLEARELAIQNSQVNMESAPWVTELKLRIRNFEQRSFYVERRVETLQHVVGNISSAMIRKADQPLTQSNVRKYICAVALPLFLAGGELFALVGSAWLDVSNRKEVLKLCLARDDRDIVVLQ